MSPREARRQQRGWRSRRLVSAGLALAFLALPTAAPGAVGDPGDVAAVDVYRESIPTSRGAVVASPGASDVQSPPAAPAGETVPVPPIVDPAQPGATPAAPPAGRPTARSVEAEGGALEQAADVGTSSPLLRLGAVLAALTVFALVAARRSRSV